MTTSDSLSPTARTTLTRSRDRAAADRRELLDVLNSAAICHLGVVVDGSPRVMPTAFGVDPAGPDREGTLYLHGSVAARSLVEAEGVDVCVTVTHVDGLVLARSGFHHSMNYRSAMIFGCARKVTEEDERGRGLDAIVNHLVPGRSDRLRPHTRKELAATVVLALPLYEASVKSRRGEPQDDASDIEIGGVWAGVLAMSTMVGPVTTAGDVRHDLQVPDSVSKLLTCGFER